MLGKFEFAKQHQVLITLPGERGKAMPRVEATSWIVGGNLQRHGTVVRLPRELNDRCEQLVTDASSLVVRVNCQIMDVQQGLGLERREAVEAQGEARDLFGNLC